MGKLMASLRAIFVEIGNAGAMSKLTKNMKAAIIAGLCGLGLCALGKRLKVTSKIAALARNIESAPFPGTRLYVFLAAKELRPLYGEIADQIVAADGFEKVLDLNTGPGYLPIEIVERRPGASVTGLDTSGDMVRIAQADARATGVADEVEYAVGDPTNLPFPGRYFDLVVSVNLLSHFRDPLQVFEEIHHILVPGGQFWIYDYCRNIPMETWETLQRELPISLRAPFELGPVASSRDAFDPDELVRLAKRTHFEDASYERQTFEIFGRPMPIFTRIRMRKPSKPRRG